MKKNFASLFISLREFLPGSVKALTVTSLLVGTGWTAMAQSITPSDIEKLLPQLESYVADALKEGKVPGLGIGIVADGKVVYAKGFGVRKAGAPEKVDADTVFQIGSVTKAFLATTEAALVDQGKLAWNDRVVDLYPTFRLADPWVTREFRIIDLLAQRSGLPGWALTDMSMFGYSQQEVIDALRYVEPVGSFRLDFAYQNAFHFISGQILARLSGVETWEEVLQKEIFDPIKMTSSSATLAALAKVENRASGHRLVKGELELIPLLAFPYNCAGAGAIDSTVNDMSRWLLFHLSGGKVDGKQVLSKENLAKTYESLVPLDEMLAGFFNLTQDDVSHYASGWIRQATPQGRFIAHAGSTHAFNSYLGFAPEHGFGVVVLTNALDSRNDAGLAIPVGKYIASRLLGLPAVDYVAQLNAELEEADKTAAAATEAKALPHRPLAEYAGRYENSTFGTIDLSVNKEGKLAFLLGPRQASVTLTPASGDIFEARVTLPTESDDFPAPHFSLKLRFVSNGEGQIDQIDWGVDNPASHPPFRRVASKGVGDAAEVASSAAR